MAGGSAAVPTTGRELIVITQPRQTFAAPPGTDPSTPVAASSRLQEAAGGVDIRNASPREIVDLGLDLHLSGYLDWEEYAMLAFQPELHPDYDRTIGALTGERAAPDKPRDYLAVWQDRVDFEYRYPAKDPEVLTRSEHIVSVFRMLDRPMDLVA